MPRYRLFQTRFGFLIESGCRCLHARHRLRPRGERHRLQKRGAGFRLRIAFYRHRQDAAAFQGVLDRLFGEPRRPSGRLDVLNAVFLFFGQAGIDIGDFQSRSGQLLAQEAALGFWRRRFQCAVLRRLLKLG